ncbi:MAG: diadenylate cyclase [Phycisphaerales bacterium]|nr:diadenylate cyclase [Phycisphaerales bacterium]
MSLDNIFNLFRGYPTWEVLVELVVIWACVWLIVRFLQGTRGAGVVKGFAVMIVLLTLSIRLLGETSDAFGRIKFISNQMLGLLAIFLIVVFQPELRQAMIRLGQTRFFGRRNPQVVKLADSITEAVEFLSKNQFGALIVIERSVRLGGLVEGGVQIDGYVTPRLLQTIFWPNSPLHDLAVVIRGDRIMASNVQLPLAETGAVAMRLGSRHRAAVGVTIESDALVVVVSEETGKTRLAEYGTLSPPIPLEEFKSKLLERLHAPVTNDEPLLDEEESTS